MMEIYDLFGGRATVDDVLAAVRRGEPSAAEREYRLFYARLYVGLYYEAHGQPEQARPYLLDAADQHRTTPGINRFMWSVADVHARRLRAEKK
jgi:lipoprotein NlpI